MLSVKMLCGEQAEAWFTSLCTPIHLSVAFVVTSPAISSIVVNIHAVSLTDTLLAAPFDKVIDDTWPRTVLVPE